MMRYRQTAKPKLKLDTQYTDAMGKLAPAQAASALDRAHEIRRFEITHYWNRANYFWLLQGAIATAFGLSASTDKSVPYVLLQGLVSLGFLTALTGYFVAEGSKFWQQNWERHIDRLENAVDGPLHKTVFVGRRGIRWSVSRLNSTLLLIFCATWSLLWVGLAAHNVQKFVRWRELSPFWNGGQLDWQLSLFLLSPFLTAGAALWLRAQWTDFGQIEDDQYVPDQANGRIPSSLAGWPHSVFRRPILWLIGPRLHREASKAGWISRKEVTGG